MDLNQIYEIDIKLNREDLQRVRERPIRGYSEFRMVSDDVERNLKKDDPASLGNTVKTEKPREVNWEFHRQLIRLIPYISDELHYRFPQRAGRHAMWEMILTRLSEGYLEYGDQLFTMSDENLEDERLQEIADEIVFGSEQTARRGDSPL